MSNRDHYKYHWKIGNKIVESGITNNLERREEERQQEQPKGHIVKVGRMMTKEGALEWEKSQPKGTPPLVANSFAVTGKNN